MFHGIHLTLALLQFWTANHSEQVATKGLECKLTKMGQIKNVTYAPNILMTLEVSSAALQPQHPMSEGCGKQGGKLPDTRPILVNYIQTHRTDFRLFIPSNRTSHIMDETQTSGSLGDVPHLTCKITKYDMIICKQWLINVALGKKKDFLFVQ